MNKKNYDLTEYDKSRGYVQMSLFEGGEKINEIYKKARDNATESQPKGSDIVAPYSKRLHNKQRL